VDTNVLVRLAVSSSALKMEAIGFSETSVPSYMAPWYSRENLIYKFKTLLNTSCDGGPKPAA